MRMTTSSTPSEDRSADWRRDTYIVIAAYNEGTCIEPVVREVREQYANVIVVDDGSSDDTFDAAKRCGAFVLRHAINRGQGAAIQTGIEFALKCGAAYIVTFDADGQHRVEDIAALVEPIARGDCEIALGSRFLGTTTKMPATRRLTLRLAVLFTRAVSRVNVTDAHNGFRAFSRTAARQMNITLDRMAHASELIDQIRATRLPFIEVPVEIRYTEYSLRKGQSSRGAIQIAIHYLLARVLQ